MRGLAHGGVIGLGARHDARRGQKAEKDEMDLKVLSLSALNDAAYVSSAPSYMRYSPWKIY
jgi:hypothetical protein